MEQFLYLTIKLLWLCYVARASCTSQVKLRQEMEKSGDVKSHSSLFYATFNDNTCFEKYKIKEEVLYWINAWTLDLIWECPRKQ